MPRKYAIPDFLEGQVAPETYERWLRRKAQSHVKRDRKRGNGAAVRAGIATPFMLRSSGAWARLRSL
jgi:hypothetical protein